MQEGETARISSPPNYTSAKLYFNFESLPFGDIGVCVRIKMSPCWLQGTLITRFRLRPGFNSNTAISWPGDLGPL